MSKYLINEILQWAAIIFIIWKLNFLGRYLDKFIKLVEIISEKVDD